jgi:hypothetical protein
VVGLTARLQPKKKFRFTCREGVKQRAQAKSTAANTATTAVTAATASATAAGATAPSSSSQSLPPGAYVISSKHSESIALDAVTLRQLMHKDKTSSGEGADLHPQIFINNTTHCTIHL